MKHRADAVGDEPGDEPGALGGIHRTTSDRFFIM